MSRPRRRVLVVPGQPAGGSVHRDLVDRGDVGGYDRVAMGEARQVEPAARAEVVALVVGAGEPAHRVAHGRADVADHPLAVCEAVVGAGRGIVPHHRSSGTRPDELDLVVGQGARQGRVFVDAGHGADRGRMPGWCRRRVAVAIEPVRELTEGAELDQAVRRRERDDVGEARVAHRTEESLRVDGACGPGVRAAHRTGAQGLAREHVLREMEQAVLRNGGVSPHLHAGGVIRAAVRVGDRADGKRPLQRAAAIGLRLGEVEVDEDVHCIPLAFGGRRDVYRHSFGFDFMSGHVPDEDRRLADVFDVDADPEEVIRIACAQLRQDVEAAEPIRWLGQLEPQAVAALAPGVARAATGRERHADRRACAEVAADGLLAQRLHVLSFRRSRVERRGYVARVVADALDARVDAGRVTVVAVREGLAAGRHHALAHADAAVDLAVLGRHLVAVGAHRIGRAADHLTDDLHALRDTATGEHEQEHQRYLLHLTTLPRRSGKFVTCLPSQREHLVSPRRARIAR